MNVRAIDPASAATSAQGAAVAGPPNRKAPPAAPPVGEAVLTTPAATPTVTSMLASVKPEDRALYPARSSSPSAAT